MSRRTAVETHRFQRSGIPGRCAVCLQGGTARVHRPELAEAEGPREIDNADFIAAARRFIRAAGRRIATGDVENLRGLVGLRADLEAAERSAAAALLSDGYSLTDLARVLGCSRQYAHKRYGATTDE